MSLWGEVEIHSGLEKTRKISKYLEKLSPSWGLGVCVVCQWGNFTVIFVLLHTFSIFTLPGCSVRFGVFYSDMLLNSTEPGGTILDEAPFRLHFGSKKMEFFDKSAKTCRYFWTEGKLSSSHTLSYTTGTYAFISDPVLSVYFQNTYYIQWPDKSWPIFLGKSQYINVFIVNFAVISLYNMLLSVDLYGMCISLPF